MANQDQKPLTINVEMPKNEPINELGTDMQLIYGAKYARNPLYFSMDFDGDCMVSPFHVDATADKIKQSSRKLKKLARQVATKSKK